MRLGVSAWRLYGQRLGIGRYIEYMVKYWNTMLMPSDRVTLYVHEPLGKNFLHSDKSEQALSEAFKMQVVRPKLTNALWENLLLPRVAKDSDVLFGPSDTLPLTYRGRSVVAIHSVNEVVESRITLQRRLTYKQKYRLSARKGDKVIVNAQCLKEVVQAHYGVPAERIEVIWLGVDDAFHPIEDEDILDATRRRYLGADRPYILFVGKLSQRRNIPTLLAAFSALKKRAKIPHSLLLVGPNHLHLPLQEMAEALDITDSLIQTDGKFSEHQELVAIYNAADLFVLPSSFEGFSLTLAEAMSCGTPAITVNRGALGEVGHGYALTIEEPTVEALTDAMQQVLSDPGLRQDLRAKGLERARLLRWNNTARRTLDVLREVAEGS